MNEDRIRNLEQWIKEDPSEPFNKYALAMELSALKPDIAALLFDELLELHSDYLPAYYTGAVFFLNQGLPEKAITRFEAGIQLADHQNNKKALKELKATLEELKFDS
jgi:tetratricopeptide (TPR) repeat protein